jgi:alcohol dehydrogenase (NADP+)
MATPTACYWAVNTTSGLAPGTITRRAPGPDDVAIAIRYSGVCHSDLHQVKNEWAGTKYPIVPGHEIVGHVTAVGANVHGFAVGQAVGVGVIVDSCRACDSCKESLEQFCDEGMTETYNSRDRKTGEITYGGYSKAIVVDQRYVLRLPAALAASDAALARAAPLLCAGITTYSPLKHWGAGPGKHVGVLGLGGLGHMAVKLAKALGAQVTVLTSSASKRDAAAALGADHVLLTSDAAAIKAAKGRFDLIIDTVSVQHDLLLKTLKRDGTVVLVGAPEHPLSFEAFGVIVGRHSIAGSIIGGIAETQEMLDFCGQHGILADVEVIPMNAINAAYDRMLKQDVRYRFVIDVSTL